SVRARRKSPHQRHTRRPALPIRTATRANATLVEPVLVAGKSSWAGGWRVQTGAEADGRRLGPRARSPSPQPHQVNFTVGTARFSGASISSNCAGLKENMPAMRLVGNISRRLL